ncbi:MAG TPA: GNAT family N-acetyltransferase [Roseateles sp.]|nr:GNAT family N-acetyltransferase [Roseateles sp.]
MQVLQTERLNVRHFERRDAAFILELLNEPSWIANIGERGVRDLAQAEVWIEDKLIATYARLGFGFWAVERRADGALLGMCGLVRRDSLPEVDLGYAFVPRAWGQGYAREAAAACLRHAHEVLGMDRLLAITGPDNLASQRVLADLGFALQETRVLEGETRQTQVWHWPAP